MDRLPAFSEADRRIFEEIKGIVGDKPKTRKIVSNREYREAAERGEPLTWLICSAELAARYGTRLNDHSESDRRGRKARLKK